MFVDRGPHPLANGGDPWRLFAVADDIDVQSVAEFSP
jgi:hypothetical protein